MAEPKTLILTGTPTLSSDEIGKIPAVFSNIFNIASNAKYTRVSFGEIVQTPEAKVHTAVVMATSDIRLLAESILRAVQMAEDAAKSSG